MRYLDSNVFLYPVLYKGKKADRARTIMEEMVTGETACATASVTLDEVVWITSHQVSREKGREVGKRMLNLPNLKILDVRAVDLVLAFRMMELHDHLKPRDAIHAAVCLNAGISALVSDDDDFDGVEGIVRENLG